MRDHFESLSLADIEAFVAEEREEDLHLDFKLVNSAALTKDDRRTFARAVSGFANSDGGLIVWGVDARRNADGIDCAQDKPGVSDAKLLLTKLNEFSGSVVNPTVTGLDHRLITVGAGPCGFVVTFVPASDSGPHMAKLGEDRYYQRSGSNFVKMEHFEVADMFGRRPRPELRLLHRRLGCARHGINSRVQVQVSIENQGRGSARAPYLSLGIAQPFRVDRFGIDGNMHHGLPMLISLRDGKVHFGGSGDTFLHSGIVLPVTVLFAEFVDGAEPPDLAVDYDISSADSPLQSGSLRLAGRELLNRD